MWGIAGIPHDPSFVSPPVPLTTGEAVGHGALAGAKGSMSLGAEMAGQTFRSGSGDPLTTLVALTFLAAGVVIAPVAAIVGAGVGAAKGTDPSEVAAARANLDAALRDVQSARAIRNEMLDRAPDIPGRQLIDCGEAASPEACRLPGDEGTVANLIVLRTNPPYFEVEGEIEPDLRLLLRAEATVQRYGQAEPAYFRAWLFRGELTPYLDLARDGAAKFREQLGAGERAIAVKAVADLLQGGVPELHPTAEQPEGTVWTVMPPGAPQAALGGCPAGVVAGAALIRPSPMAPAPAPAAPPA